MNKLKNKPGSSGKNSSNVKRKKPNQDLFIMEESLDPLQLPVNDEQTQFQLSFVKQEIISSDDESKETIVENLKHKKAKKRVKSAQKLDNDHIQAIDRVNFTTPVVKTNESEVASECNYNPIAKKSKKSSDKYEEFITWQKTVGMEKINENTLLAYFAILSNKLEPNSLLATYSTIKTMLWKKEKINIRHYNELNMFLKRNCKSDSKQKEVPEACNISDFSNESSDENDVNELTPDEEISDFEDHNDVITAQPEQDSELSPGNSESSKICNAIYLRNYNKFLEWRVKRGITEVNEEIFIDYFETLSLELLPTTLKTIYSSLKNILKEKEQLDISKFADLHSLIKEKFNKHERKKFQALTTNNISDFLHYAPDKKYLCVKVILIFSICGGCRYTELKLIRPSDVQEHGKMLQVKVPTSGNKYSRVFFIYEEFYSTVKKYMKIRPTDPNLADTFFLNYQHERCTRQVVGRNKMASVPKQVAEFLKLPNPQEYSGYSIRATSEADISTIRSNLIKLRQMKVNSDQKFNQDPLENDDSKDPLTDHSITLDSCPVKEEVTTTDSESEENSGNGTFNQSCVTPGIKMSVSEEKSDKTPAIVNLDEENIDTLSEESRAVYQRRYDKFVKWRESRNITTTDEKTLLDFFETLSAEYKPNTLDSMYAGIKLFLTEKEQIDTSKFTELKTFLKLKSKDYEPTKAEAFTVQNISDFIKNAPDIKYLVAKVVLIFGICGGCKTSELKKLNFQDVKEHGSIFCVNVPSMKKKIGRTFIIDEEFYPIVKQYIDFRPKDVMFKNFFAYFQGGKGSKQPIGRNTIASVPKEIAQYLELPNPQRYTCSSFTECFKNFRTTFKIYMGKAKRHKDLKNSTSENKDAKSNSKLPDSSNANSLHFESCFIKEEVNSSDSED